MFRGLRICVVGSGPSGFYTVKYLMKKLNDNKLAIDILDQLPTPYGLVRSGVAPDHPEVKNVQNEFDQIASDTRVSFFGNVHIGKDLTIKNLRSLYDILIIAHGAGGDRRLGIPGETLKGVLPARAFVNWYNGHPDYVDIGASVDEGLKSCGTVVIIGMGNVALDCARILTKGYEELQYTDIAPHALSILASNSNKRRVIVAGRRSHLQANFTIKELRELTRLKKAVCTVNHDELLSGRNFPDSEALLQDRAYKKIDDVLSKLPYEHVTMDTACNEIQLRFLLSPREILPSENRPDWAGRIVMERNSLMYVDGAPPKATPTGNCDTMRCGLVLCSIGYSTLPIDGLPFDHSKGVILCEENSTKVHGLRGVYCVGWARRGPNGIIGTNIHDAKAAADEIAEDVQTGTLSLDTNRLGRNGLTALLREKGCQYVDWSGFKQLDLEEQRRGAILCKPREKIVSVLEMLSIISMSK